MKKIQLKPFYFFFLIVLSAFSVNTQAQTDVDGIMMEKNNFCTGLMYGNSSWRNYWEGTYKRDNENLGKVSTQMLSVMGNYGISERLNVLFGVPYIKTKASEGTLHGVNGIQDLSLWIKYMPVETELGKGTFSLYGIGGFSFPLINYVADYQPLAIGLHSKTFTARLMVDYQTGNIFATVSGSYMRRGNISIDRTSYYTNGIHLANEVEMPDAAYFNFRTGYRSGRLIAEAIITNTTTLKGFDIRKNDMPFPSNKMNATALGANIKYNVKAVDGLSLIANGSHVLAGRNAGQATAVGGGIFYILDFTKKAAPASSTLKTN